MILDDILNRFLLSQHRSHRSSLVSAMLLLPFLFMMSIATMFLTCQKVLAFPGLSLMAYLYLSFSYSKTKILFLFFTGQSIEKTKRAVVQHLLVFQDQTLSRQLHQEEDQIEAQ